VRRIAPFGAPGAMPESRATAANQNLLYVSDDRTNQVYIFSYPHGDKVGVLSGFDSPKGCQPKSGRSY